MTRQSMWDEWIKTDEGQRVYTARNFSIAQVRQAFDAGVLATQAHDRAGLDSVNARAVGTLKCYRATTVFDEVWIMPLPPRASTASFSTRPGRASRT